MTRTAVVFPGQGSQRAGMASAWAGHPAARTFEEVGAATGLDLVRLADDAEALRATAVAQPAVFAASLAAWRALTDAGVEPAVVAGHSLGEVTAAVASGALSLRDGAALVGERGRAMGEACAREPGTMAAVLGLSDEAVADLRRGLSGAVVANDNAAGQIVLSGAPDAVERAAAAARELGGRVRMLEVEGAFHSPAMTPALVRVSAALARTEVCDPDLPLVTGVSGALLGSGEDIARALTDGILAPVRWRAVQERLADLGVERLIEAGPGGVLRGLARRALPEVEVFAVDDPSGIAPVGAALAGDLDSTARSPAALLDTTARSPSALLDTSRTVPVGSGGAR